MATKKKAEPQEEKPAKEPKAKAPKKKEEAAGEELLQKAAKAIGTAIGTVAVKTGIAHPAAPPRKRIPKLAKKDKKRLPRKAKKLAKKKLLSAAP
jgi:hypothetical protein